MKGVGNYITFSSNMELILKLHVNYVMLFILNFLINFNPVCAVKFGYNRMLVKVNLSLFSVFLFSFTLLPVLW